MGLNRLRDGHGCLAKDSTAKGPPSTPFLKQPSPNFQIYPAFESIANQIIKADQNNVC